MKGIQMSGTRGFAHGESVQADLSPSSRTPSRCESCRLRPFEVIDSRFGQPAFGICYECWDGGA